MRKYGLIGAFAAVAMLGTGVASAAGLFTNGVPPAGGTQYPTTLPLTGNELLPADTQLPGGLNPQSEAISTAQIAGYIGSSRGTGFRNALIGGDFTTNLWQRGTSVGTITTTATYTADRLFAWSGTSTTMSVAQDTTAGEFSPGYAMAAKVSRTGAGVVQTCVAQIVESTGSYVFQGTTPELDFIAAAGAGFSATASQVQAYITYGTAVDEGASKFAFGLNGGGGGSSGWTGQTNVVAALVPISTTVGRYVAVGTVIPATAKEIGVAICWTPVGASPTNDYVALSGLQLTRNSSLSALAGTAVATTNVQASAFERRPQEIETGLQQRYFVGVPEPATGAAVSAICEATGATAGACTFTVPVTMRGIPVVTIPATGTFKVNIAGTATTWVTPTAGTCSVSACNLTIGNTNTAGQVELVTGGGGTGSVLMNAEL